MKLKKLEIIGFKSFLDKAAITFPAGVCAVVGPNGCGKSNIVDALRWVMGEQSVKQLRGKNKEDIIFAGASNKAPTNMAEVSVTLKNDNGSAPEVFKDYSEIMVTRRLYRSGESAYLINKQPCRLKDIHDVFVGSGMGARTYSIIGQGNIGAITDAGPDERRTFLEEAAGVTRYKARKAETLSKIKSTNQNLLRVNDIVSEVERQMQGLKRQAQKAQRYRNYQKEIKHLDSRLLCHYHDDMSRQIAVAQRQFNQLQDTDLGHSNQIKKLEASVEEVKLKRWEKNQEISTQKSHIHELQREADRAETQLSHFKTDKERFDDEIIELEDTHEELEFKNKRIQSDMEHIKQKISDLETQIVDVSAQLEKESTDSDALKDELSELNRQVETHKNELMQLVAKEAGHQNSLKTAEASKENILRRLRRIDEETVTAAQKKSQLEQNVAASREELTQIKADIKEYNQQIANFQSLLEKDRQSLSRYVKETQSLESDFNKAGSQLGAQQKMADNFEWYKDGVKAIMKACKENQQRPGKAPQTPSLKSDNPQESNFLNAEVIGIIADVIDTKPEYRIAVEAALGEALQYLIVNNYQDGKEAINFLKSAQAGRSGFIPISRLAAQEEKNNNNLKYQLLDHVKVTPGFEAVAKTLLGNVLVADDLDQALELFQDNQTAVTVVTLAGEIITSSGVMVGGSQNKLSNIFAKKQELKELENQVKTLGQALEKATMRNLELEKNIESIEAELKEVSGQRVETIGFETETEKELYKLTEDLKHAQRQLVMVQSEQERLLDEESDLDHKVETYQRDLNAIKARIEAAKNNIFKSSNEMDTVSRKLEEFSKYTVDLKLKQTTLQSDLTNNHNTLKRLDEFQKDGTKRLEQINREIVQKRENKESLKQKTVDNQSFLKNVYEQLKELEQALSKNEADFQAIDARLKENDVEISRIQRQREENRKEIRVVEIDLSEKRVKLENIDQRCYEHYHVKIDSLKETLALDTFDADKPPEKISQMEAELARLKARLASIGNVNLGAIEEYHALKERYDFLVEQRDDLITAIEDLHKVIRKINKITQERFLATFNAVNDKLKEVFPKLFEGGSAWLELTDPNNLLESGVEYMIQPAGKKLTRMSLLSGGEKALSAIGFIFSIFLLKPASFCLMDEIDAPLDDANVFRFNQLLKIIGQNSQIIMITHNKRSMEFADTLFGITMEQKGISKVVSVNLQNTN